MLLKILLYNAEAISPAEMHLRPNFRIRLKENFFFI